MIVSEIKYNQIIEKLRFDAEFYKPEYLELLQFIRYKKFRKRTVRKLSYFVKKGIFDISPERYKLSGIPLFRVQNIGEVLPNANNLIYISENDHILENKTELQPGDILISKVGTIGNVAMITNEFQKCNFSQNVIGVKIKKDEILPEYLTVYLNTKYGRLQLEREQMHQVQSKLELESVRNVIVILPSNIFQQKIESLVKESYNKRKEADEKYKQAEELLNKMLEIEKLELKDEKIFETRFDEVESALRFDAEHYQPKYGQVKEFIAKSGYEVKKLSEVVEISNKKIEPSSQSTQLFNYIELANVNPSTGEIEEVNQVKGHNAPSRARMLVKKGDVLVPSLLGSLDNMGLVPDELDGSVASTGFFVIRPKTFLSEFLFLLFRSKLIRLQLEEKTAGAIMSAVPKTTFGDLLIPIIPLEKQRQISELVKQSFTLRKEAKELLEKAKKEVEEFIEKNSNCNRH